MNSQNENSSPISMIELGEKLFQWRDYTPIPLIIILLFTAEPGVVTATLGTLFVVFGELTRLYSVGFIGAISRTRKRHAGEDEQLITSGPFSIVRNPLYVGNFFICLGLAVFGGVIWVLILTVLLFGFQYHAIVKYEESLLMETFGDKYSSYADTVPPWVPKHFPPLDEWQWPDSLSPAIRSEKRTFAAIGLMLLALILVGR